MFKHFSLLEKCEFSQIGLTAVLSFDLRKWLYNGEVSWPLSFKALIFPCMLKTLKNPESFADLFNQRGFQSFLQIFIKLYIYNVSLHSKFLVCAYNDSLSYSRYIGSFVDISWNYEHWFNCWFFHGTMKTNVLQCFHFYTMLYNYWEERIFSPSPQILPA